MAYEKVGWKDYPDKTTPINAQNLNHMDDALSAAGIRTMVHGVGERAGIERLHPHRFRVSRITHLVDRGMPLQDVQELAGHTSINTTRGYYRNTLDNVKHSYLKAAQ